MLGPAPSRIPRNRPCPCGSGRKHKACCLPRLRHPLPARAPLVYTRIAEYAQRPANSSCYDAYLGLCANVVPLLALDPAIFEGGLLRRYLDARGHLLPDDERALAEAWRTTPLARFLHDGEAPRVIALPHRVFPMHRQALLDLLDGGYQPEQLAAFFSSQPPLGSHGSISTTR